MKSEIRNRKTTLLRAQGLSRKPRPKADPPPADFFTPPFINGLAEDVQETQRALLASDTPYIRRSLVRTFFAAVEGITFAVKQTALRAHAAGAVQYSTAELAVLKEEKYMLGREGMAESSQLFLRMEENVTFALAMALRRYNQPYCQPRNEPGWSAFRAAIALRHRLTHPKSLADLFVSNEDLESVRTAIEWFDRATDQLLDLEIARVKGQVPAGVAPG